MKKDKSRRRKALVWIVERGISQVSIHRDLKHKQVTQVNETLQGVRNDRRVLQYLIDKGCPVEYLDLPENMKLKDQA